jgi:hypothetical protein
LKYCEIEKEKNSRVKVFRKNSMCEKRQNCYRQRIYIYWINFLTSKRKRRGSCGDMCGVCIYFSCDKLSLQVFIYPSQTAIAIAGRKNLEIAPDDDDSDGCVKNC